MTGSHPNHTIGSCDRCADDPGVNGIASLDADGEAIDCPACGHMHTQDTELDDCGPCVTCARLWPHPLTVEQAVALNADDLDSSDEPDFWAGYARLFGAQ